MTHGIAHGPGPAEVERSVRRLEGMANASVRAVVPFDGGASNITSRIDLAGAPVPAVVIRVQREAGIFEPYDVLREGRVMTAVRAAGLPVPAVLGSGDGRDDVGGPYLLIEFVDAPHMGEAGAEASFDAFVEAVVRVHTLDWRAAGLDFMGVPATPAAGLAAELEAIDRRSRRFIPGGDPLLARASARLRETIPADGSLALCQGDINIFNYLFRGGRVVAIVDWEQARIGDPRSDVGQLVALAHLKGMPFGPPRESPFVSLYEAAAKRDVLGLEWFRARWLYELAVIHHGWRAFNGSEPWYGWDDVTALLETALAEI